MSMFVHALEGCAPTPLASYLKAIAILRLVGTQGDAGARGWWKGETWMLATKLSRSEMEDFFLERYAPTPTLSPWNKGSGFYATSEALTALEKTTGRRFLPFRSAIGAVRELLDRLVAADMKVREIKDEAKPLPKAEKSRLKSSDAYRAKLAAAERDFKAAKASLLPACRRAWRGPLLDWMSAAVTLIPDGDPSYPPMLGTGGNDGRFDFTYNFMQRLGELFDLANEGRSKPEAALLLQGALWGAATRGMASVSVGQFAPGAAGGANSANGPTADGQVNPWDWVFALEGSVAFSAAATRRLSANAPGSMSTPFMVRSHSAGHGSASVTEDAPRGEQWLPLWSQPTGFAELGQLLAEGRAQLDRRVARQPLELARAIARLGVARGLETFERYGYLERNGQSNLAVPLGRVTVEPRPHASLLDDVAEWMGRLQREGRAKHAPARLREAERRLADAAFEAATHDHTAQRWQAMLLAMADVETLIATGSALKAGAIPRLRPAWVELADDGSPDLRLAVSLGLASALDRSSGRGRRVDDLRSHWLPLDQRGRLVVRDGRLARDPRVVASSRDPETDLIAVLSRRLIEARSNAWSAPIVSERGASATLDDLDALLRGTVDLDRTVRLARAFMAIDRRAWVARTWSKKGRSLPDDAWLCLRAASSPWPLVEGGVVPPPDLSMVQRLASGDAEGAVRLALRRLQSIGQPAPIRVGVADPATARRWAAALTFPISPATSRAIARRLHLVTQEGA
ncbi:MAG: type I-U CRISPR-associated protein Csx17 [Deltaproteobacteria bacterium]|nr:type I-U CRISPR-associated protein Csx17 [Deltaproteobacteria bacterium]